MPDFHTISKFPGQGVEKRPECGQVTRAKRRRKLEPVLADTISQWHHAAEKFFGQIAAVTQRSVMRNGGRKLKAKAEIIGSLFTPTLNNFCSGEGIKRGIAFNTVNMSGMVA